MIGIQIEDSQNFQFFKSSQVGISIPQSSIIRKTLFCSLYKRNIAYFGAFPHIVKQYVILGRKN